VSPAFNPPERPSPTHFPKGSGEGEQGGESINEFETRCFHLLRQADFGCDSHFSPSGF